MTELNEKQLIVARQEYKPYLSFGQKSLSKLKLKTSIDFFNQKLNTTFESLGCIGYNSEKQQLTATINIKRASGYSGSLCENGSYEYVRFYLDYQDGEGWEDMGVVGVNVHDIPTKKDCDGDDEKPINFVARLDIAPSKKICSVPNLPKVKAVLAWNTIPEPNDPDLTKGTYVWSDVKEGQIQIEGLKFFIPDFPVFEFDGLLNSVISNPNISLNQLILNDPESGLALQKAKQALIPKALNFSELSSLYNKHKIEPHRFAYKSLQQVINTPYSNVVTDLSNIFQANNWNLADSLNKLNNMNCNTDYEELVCVGADYNREALVGTLRVKKNSGYSGSLCSEGSKEYVSFWVQNEESCDWTHAGTASVKVHDIQNIPDGGLFYSVVLPYKFDGLKDKCNAPKVLKIRAVLSWNVPPTGRNCSNWGNVIESYVQLKPSDVWTGNGPKLVAVGGVNIDFINNLSGLTVPNSHFIYSGLPVRDDSAFGGLIVVQAKTNAFAAAGRKYKIKTTNLTTGEETYINNSFRLDDIFSFSHANSSDEYQYLGDDDNNTNNIVARFYPGTDDRLRVTIEHSDGFSFSQVIQMDNTYPSLTLNIENYGDCSHFVKGGEIKGSYNVQESYLESYRLTTTVANIGDELIASGTISESGNFTIVTSASKNCGEIVLSAVARTIQNSTHMMSTSPERKIICLKDAE